MYKFCHYSIAINQIRSYSVFLHHRNIKSLIKKLYFVKPYILSYKESYVKYSSKNVSNEYNKLCRHRSIIYNANFMLKTFSTYEISSEKVSQLSQLQPKYRNYRVVEEVIDEEFVSTEKWNGIIGELSSSESFHKPVFDTYVMKACLRSNNLSLAECYVDYLNERDERLNFVALSSYALLLAKNIEKIDENKFLSIYEELKAEEHLPHSILANVIEALSFTKHWEKAFEHLMTLEGAALDEGPLNLLKPYNCIMRAIARNKGLYDVYSYIESIELNLSPLQINNYLEDETIIQILSIIQVCDECKKEEQLKNLFEILRKFERPISEKVSDILITTLPSSWQSLRTSIANRESCQGCEGKLTPILLNQETFNQLKKACEEKAVKGQDIFQQTTLREWENFLQFLKINGPFDITLDGLNIMYMSKFNEKQIKNIILSACQRYKKGGKVLLISREHMRKKLITYFGSLQAIPNLKYFFVDNVTKDDAFILYAAMYSGLGSKFITRDYLRNHKFVMGNKALMRQFRHWQDLHQLLLVKKKGKLLVKQPYQYHRIPQFNEEAKSWHIPVETQVERDYIDASEDWLCLKLPK